MFMMCCFLSPLFANGDMERMEYAEYFQDLKMGLIVDNKVKIYGFDISDESWEEDGYSPKYAWEEYTESHFSLPNGYKDVFGFGRRYIGVTVGDKLKMYTFDDDDYDWEIGYFWEEDVNTEFSLPYAYDSIFDFSFDRLGVTAGNKLRIYDKNTNNNSWEEDTTMNISLPEGYKNVFGFGLFYIGITVDNKLKFYVIADDAWIENKILEFSLPEDYKNVFGMGMNCIGVIFEDSIKIYTYAWTGWEEIKDCEFSLPEGFINAFGIWREN